MNILYLTSIWIFLMVSATYWFMPNATPKTVVFGVRVPPSRIDDPSIISLRRSFHMYLLIGSALVFLLLIIFPYYAGSPTLTLSSVFAELIFAYLNYIRVNRALERTKTSEGWYDNLNERVSAVYPEVPAERRDLIPIMTIIPAVAIVAATIYIGVMVYPSLPATIPTHFNASGVPFQYSQKSVFSAFLLVFMQIGLTAMMFFIGYAISRSRQEVDASRLLESQLQQKRFKHYTRDGLNLLAALIDISLLSGSLNIWLVIPSRDTIIFTLLPVLAGSLVLVIALMSVGQMGSRLPVTSTSDVVGSQVSRNDDRFWILGSIYYNKGDRAILVGKRFGVGWTFNFARPVTWLIFSSILIFGVLIPVLLTARVV